jgi:Tfp pilus assembly protein PilO
VIYRRQKKQYVFAGLVGAIAVINILFFVILHYPARSEYVNLKDSISRLKSQNASQQISIVRLEQRTAELDRFEQDRRELFQNHFIKRDAGFVQILPELEGMGQKTGVRNNRKDFLFDVIPQYGMYSVRIKIPVQGGYNNVVNFIRELETSKTFFLINSIDVRSTNDSTPGATPAANSKGSIALAMDLETFFYQ